ncbi:PQ-loop domain-containing transporter [Mesorhizobium sp. AR02]|uniref:PQ-loop domain-containing transporter n=1 Tax=Mesorhizobium sp. AR02 TaxID=2865837 RepID=UPI002160A3D3|nr:PQ-loop domain-containing transporter [Mesorhizobium sp. AR02]
MTSFTPQAWKIIKTRDTSGISADLCHHGFGGMAHHHHQRRMSVAIDLRSDDDGPAALREGCHCRGS